MEKQKQIEGILLHLSTLRDEGILIVVEGKKDRKALESFGITNITTLDKPLFVVAEEIAEKHRDCVLLLDLDSEGRRLFGMLSQDLKKNGVKINNRFREFLFRETELRQIEGLVTYISQKG